MVEKMIRMGIKKKLGKNPGKKMVFVPVTDTITDLDKIDDLLYFDVMEGYRKIGRFKFGDIKVKFR